MSATKGDGREFGWRVHGAIESWTGKADSKASIALAIETATAGLVVNFSRDSGPLTGLEHGQLAWMHWGVFFLGLAILMALAVVTPQLRRMHAKEESKKNYIFFGHLRHWNPKDLQRKLSNLEDQERQLANQLVAMSKVAWRKHSFLQVSLMALGVAVLCFFLAGST